MKLRRLSVMLILALCMSLVPVTVFAASAAVTLNPVTSVEQGGSVTISGTSTLNEVIIQVLRPNNAGTVFYDITKVTDGKFSSTFTLPRKESAGTYKAAAGQGNQVDTKDFVVTAAATPPDPTDPGETPGTITPPVTPPVTPPPVNPPGPIITGPTNPAVPSDVGKPVTPPQTKAPVVAVDPSKNAVKQTTAANGRITNIVTVDDAALAAALAKAAGQDNHGDAPIISVSFNNKPGETVSFNLSGAALAAAAKSAPDTIISLQTNDGEYSLPIRLIDLAALAQKLGAAEADIRIQVSIGTVDADMNARIKASAQGISASQIGSAMGFSIYAEGNGQTVEINNFGNTYVDRSIVAEIPAGAAASTVVLYDTATGQFSFVPAVFVKQADGTYKITFKRNGNSMYTVLSLSKTFTDIEKHWAKADIELLASKLVVNGVANNKFAPSQDITRAEFAALLVRSLGLTADAASASFKDVKSSDWFAGSVGAAVKAKLVEGFSDNSFKPNAPITREQMAVMVSRAISAAGKKVEVSSSNAALSVFKDQASISSWAKSAVSQAVEAQIITGVTDKTFVPAANASRAQATVMLKRLLQFANFIN